MERRIINAVLFVSRFSKESAPCVQFIEKQSLSMEVIYLDSETIREAVQSGTFIQIQKVPTLLLEYNDGSIQLYVGRVKVIEWLKQLFNRSIQQNKPIQQHKPIMKPRAAKTSISKKSTALFDTISSGELSSEEFLSEEDPDVFGITTLVGEDNAEGSPVELIMEKPSAPSTLGLTMTPNIKRGNTSLMNKAKQMQSDRNQALGYKDD